MKSIKLSLVLQLLVIFLSGAVVGALGHRFYGRQKASPVTAEPPKGGRGGGEIRRGYTEFMRLRLKLSAEQVRRLDAIYDNTDRRFSEVRNRAESDPTVKAGFAKWRELMQASSPEMDAIGKDQSAQIQAMLNENQKAEYEKILKERAANPRRRGGRGDGLPPMGPRGGAPGAPPSGQRR